MADLQTSATKKHRAEFIVISSRKMKTMDEGRVDRRRSVFLVEKEKGLSRKLI
jgi:hypothetical protein